MKREILCVPCMAAHDSADVPAEVGEHVHVVRGLVRCELICDLCGGRLPPKADAFARSSWFDSHGQPWYEWEHGLLDGIAPGLSDRLADHLSNLVATKERLIYHALRLLLERDGDGAEIARAAAAVALDDLGYGLGTARAAAMIKLGEPGVVPRDES